MKVLITGGAGFIGSNASAHYLAQGQEVVILDDLSRKGAADNLAWLQGNPGRLIFVSADVRDSDAIDSAFREHADTELVLHLAGQVAVTSSVADPKNDFEVNALGTLNVLEASRRLDGIKALLNASTNKVYGELKGVEVDEGNDRFEYRHLPGGISESQNLDFHSPYGCSKGSADQYVIDYARIYGLPTVTFRQSCIYGLHQFGMEDQGWLAWFCIAAAKGREITIFGNGKQVRHILHVQDLLKVYDAAASRIDEVKGGAFNIGGGPENTLSLLELIAMLEERLDVRIAPKFADWRRGDQRVFIADISKSA